MCEDDKKNTSKKDRHEEKKSMIFNKFSNV